ncbi:cell wall anchor [Lentzea sp. NBRC 105346]|uniref:polysaccharide deacetylase family protein n=1 Tax=Lentzea sp. NBRC 105346 TaxID=3032205 RepID=UPI0024A4D5D6|nr:polysaccharide deacetylase family protein [Lentzea sp. NBRC 105346]GLZ30254.1 cell wall anchor [Lentzea sp. NBRC 105346]
MKLSKLTLGAVGTVAALVLTASPGVQAAPISLGTGPQSVGELADRLLPGPPKPATSKPAATNVEKRKDQPGVLSTVLSPLVGQSSTAAAAASNGKAAPGAPLSRKTLVLYDSTGSWAWLGEAYAVVAANLVSHGSAYVMHPVSSYAAGEMAGYTGVIYIGSTYDEPLPTAFLDDVLAGSRPVLWMAHNIWQLSARAANFTAQYGWNWSGFDFGEATEVTYKGVALNRDELTVASGLMVTQISDATKAAPLAVANGSAAGPINWATRSGNLTYIGEIPFSYVGHGDRYLAAADLISDIANPAGPDRKRALVRIEDVGPDADPAELRAVADYLYAQKVPFTVAVYPQFENPLGAENGGVPESYSLASRPQVITALRYMQNRGGTLLMHGYTHQFGKIKNPYDGMSANDFEFYRAHIDPNDSVIYDGPVPGDSAAWMQGRINSSRTGFMLAGFAAPTIFEPPHYAASAVDYQVIQNNFGKRYDRGLYFGGYCPNGACGTGIPQYDRIFGQYFPYLVRDIYGSVVAPEGVGNVEPEPFNHHPARLPADLIDTARSMKVVKDGVASFFYHPYLGTSYLQQTVSGIKALGYQFVPVNTVMAG